MALQPRALLKQLRLLIVAVVPLLRLSAGESCDIDVPAGAWPNGAAKEAALTGSPKFTVPHVGSGFNRTLDIDGFCANLLYTSESFDCNEKAAGELQLKMKAQNGVFLRFDNANCPLSAISLRRTAPGSEFDAEMRFQFETCLAAAGAAAPPATAAAITVGLKEGKAKADSASFVEDVGRNSNLMPWLTEACDWEKDKPTVAPKANTLVLNVATTSALVGNGTCGGPEAVVKKTEKQSSQAVCREQCTSSITKAKENKDKEPCTGFAYEAKTNTCTLYTGAITAFTEVKGTVCYTTSLLNQDADTVTTPTPESALETGLQKQALHMREVFGGDALSSKTAKLEGIFAPDACSVGSAWWFTLQDAAGTPMSIEVVKENWVKLMAKLPAYKVTDSKVVGATVQLDTVLVRGCKASSVVTWGRDCSMPAAKTVCDSKELINAIITGAIVPFAACWIVKLVHSIASSNIREEFTAEQVGEHPRMPMSLTLILCAVAVVAAAGLAAGSSTLVNVAFGLNGCLHGSREVIVVSCATGLATAIALLVAVLYCHFSFKEVQKTVVDATPMNQSPKQSKLMLVESYDGGRSGRPVNPDVMASGQSAMNSYIGSMRFQIE